MYSGQLNEFGQILVYRPSSQDIEDEKFELDFSFLVASNEDLEKIQSAASNVSEIEKVVGKEVSEFHLEGEETLYRKKNRQPQPRLRKKKKNLLLSQKKLLQQRKKLLLESRQQAEQ